MNTNKQLKNKIMRRVYGAFAMRVAYHPVTLQVVTFGLALVVLAELVHVKRVMETLLSASVNEVAAQAFNIVSTAFLRGEVLTLIVVAVLTFTALSLPWQALKLTMPKRFAVAKA